MNSMEKLSHIPISDDSVRTWASAPHEVDGLGIVPVLPEGEVWSDGAKTRFTHSLGFSVIFGNRDHILNETKPETVFENQLFVAVEGKQ